MSSLILEHCISFNIYFFISGQIAQDLNVTMDIVFRFGLYVMVMKNALMEVTRGKSVKVLTIRPYKCN